MPAACIALLFSAGFLTAGDRFEVSAHVGPSFPFYAQSFQYDLGAVPGLPAAITVEQVRPFRLDAGGGVALGGSLAWFFREPLGLEARIDLAALDVQETAARFRVRIGLPPPLPALSQEVEAGGGEIDVDRPRPISVNLKARWRGRPGVFASAGLSYLPRMHLTAHERLGLGSSSLDPRIVGVDLATIPLEAEALPLEEDEGHWGMNVGAGLGLTLGRRLEANVEGRYFRFQKRTLRWQVPRAPGLPPLAEALRGELERRLEPIEFDPTYFQLTAGLAWRF